jgi:hypothetical protein
MRTETSLSAQFSVCIRQYFVNGLDQGKAADEYRFYPAFSIAAESVTAAVAYLLACLELVGRQGNDGFLKSKARAR